MRSLRENLGPRPCRIDRVIIRQGRGLRFSRKTERSRLISCLLYGFLLGFCKPVIGPWALREIIMTWVYSRSNVCSDWLILGHYSPVMSTSRLRVCKSQAKSHMINNLLTSNVRSLRENLKTRPCCIDLAIARSIRQGLGPRFSRKDLTLG